MWPSLEKMFQPWSAKFEGNALPFPYADVKNLVTTGTGNLIDPVSAMLALPWRISTFTDAAAQEGDRAATPAEITAAFNLVKSKNTPGVINGTQLDNGGSKGGYGYYKFTNLRLTPTALANFVTSKLRSNDADLLRIFPDSNTWPVDAQLAMHSFAWAAGLGHVDPSAGKTYDFKNLHAALAAKDFTKAADQIHLGGFGIADRNDANKLLMQNAAAVVSKGLDPSIMQWPLTPDKILAGIKAGADDAYNYVISPAWRGAAHAVAAATSAVGQAVNYAAQKPGMKLAGYMGVGALGFGAAYLYSRYMK